MGVYIKDMEMPRRGMVVNIYADGRVTNHFDEFGKTIGKAVPVPPHGRLIDADALLRDFPIRLDHYDKEHGNKHFVYGVETVMDYVGEMPTIIESED